MFYFYSLRFTAVATLAGGLRLVLPFYVRIQLISLKLALLIHIRLTNYRNSLEIVIGVYEYSFIRFTTTLETVLRLVWKLLGVNSGNGTHFVNGPNSSIVDPIQQFPWTATNIP